MASLNGKRKAPVVDLTISDDEGFIDGQPRKVSRYDPPNRFSDRGFEEAQPALPLRRNEPRVYIDLDDETRAAELVEGSQDDDSYANYELYGIVTIS